MKVFLDTNVILDFYDSNRGHYMPTAIVFDLAIKGEIQLAVCAQSFITAFYLLRKAYDKDELYRSMKSLFKLCVTRTCPLSPLSPVTLSPVTPYKK